VTRALFHGVTTDLSYVHDGHPEDDGKTIALTGNGPKQTDLADAIVLAHNALPALLDIAEAARTIADGGWVDTDGETGDQWCHWCEAMDGHHEGCWFVDLRAALDRLEEVGS
jgi:hypothetical protein